MERKTKEVDLFGRKVIISERGTRDVQEMMEFTRQSEDKMNDAIVLSLHLLILEAALKDNLKRVRFPFQFKRKKWNKMFAYESLESISPRYASELATEVMKLEGHSVDGEVVKKNKGKTSQGKSSTE